MKLDDLNRSELASLAQDENPNAHRGLERETLLRIATGEEVDLPYRPVDDARDRIGKYIQTYWKQVEPLLNCPAKSKNPRACYQCTDVQAVECATWNKSKIDKE